VATSWHARLSRREVLRTGIGLGAAVGAGALWASGTRPAPAAAAAAQSLPLITKPVPVSGERLPAIGLGTDKFRDSERTAIGDEVARMQQLGGTVIDTSADYGESEGVVGDTLASLGLRDRMFVATKLTAGGEGFGSDGVGGAASFQRSLQRLHTRRVDLLQVHNLDGVDQLMPLMQRWKQAGQIRYLGVTTSEVGQHADMMGYMRRYPLDFIQVDYSLDNRDAAKEVLPLAMQRRIGVLVNIPFGYGSLLRQAQHRRLPPWAADIDVATWGQFLLKYVISHPAVTVAIPGSTQVAHLVDNQGAARGRLPDAAQRRKMEQYWDAG
jgi:aryl-alcohol dehydrogenase-like predicted oxidoreductase